MDECGGDQPVRQHHRHVRARDLDRSEWRCAGDLVARCRPGGSHQPLRVNAAVRRARWSIINARTAGVAAATPPRKPRNRVLLTPARCTATISASGTPPTRYARPSRRPRRLPMQALDPNEIKQLLAMLQEGLDVPPQQ